MNTTTASTRPSFTPALGRLVATVSVGFVVTQLDVTIVNIALPNISADLHASVAGLQWILQSVAAISAVLLIIAAALACLIHPESHAR